MLCTLVSFLWWTSTNRFLSDDFVKIKVLYMTIVWPLQFLDQSTQTQILDEKKVRLGLWFCQTKLWQYQSDCSWLSLHLANIWNKDSFLKFTVGLGFISFDRFNHLWPSIIFSKGDYPLENIIFPEIAYEKLIRNTISDGICSGWTSNVYHVTYKWIFFHSQL